MTPHEPAVFAPQMVLRGAQSPLHEPWMAPGWRASLASWKPRMAPMAQSVAEMDARLDTLEKEYNALIDQRNALRREGDNMVSQIAQRAIITEATKHRDYYVRSLAHAYLTSHPVESEGGCVGEAGFASEDARGDPTGPDPGCGGLSRPMPE